MDVVNRARDILIVDDVPENLRVLSSVLREKDYQVRTVLSAKMAFSAIQMMQPDLILLDVNLPDIDGYSVCQKLKENPKTAAIPIIFLSALGETANKVSAFRVGGVDYITKPFQIEEVLMRVGLQLQLKSLSEDLRNKNKRLSQLIIDLEHQNKELIQARELAEKANQAKSVFLSRINHELRTPLTAILGYNQLLMGDASTTQYQRESMEIIERSGRHLLTLINDVLDISKIEANRTELTLNTFNIKQFLQTIHSMFRLEAESKGLEFSLQYRAEIPDFVQADENRIRQILINLLGNALKFTESGYIRLSIMISSIQGEMLELCCAVEDSGVGIPATELSKLFEPFQQTEVGLSSGQGSGLGLCISRQLARLMGGEITVETQEGKGSTFIAKIPVQRSPLSAVEQLADATTARDTTMTFMRHSISHQNSQTRACEALSLQSMQKMPRQWLRQFYDAVIALDEITSEQLLSSIPENHGSLKQSLKSLLTALDYEPILKTLETFEFEAELEGEQLVSL